MIKYIVVPGRVASISDGQLHYIGARRLIELYAVREDECVIVHDYPGATPYYVLTEQYPNAVVLDPDFTGRYERPLTKGGDATE